MNDPWRKLIAADPSRRSIKPDDELLTRIRRQSFDSVPRRPRRFWQRLSRGAAVVIAALIIGGTVSWAATGTSPTERFNRIFGLDPEAGLSVDESAYGLDRFSILEPMTARRIGEMPATLKQWLLMVRVIPPKPPPVGPKANDQDWNSYVTQEPGRIGAWGSTTLETGERVDVVSMNGQVCVIFDRFHGGNCGTVNDVERTGIATTMRENAHPFFEGTIGLVPDNVVSLRIDYPGFGEVPIQDNVFRAEDIPHDRFFILGEDEAGTVVTRVYVSKPITPAQRRFMERAPGKQATQRRKLRLRPGG